MTNFEPWWARAACRGSDRIDPSLPGLSHPVRAKIAAFYCLECPVKAQCAADALKHRDIGTVRAGIYIAANRSTPDKRSRTRLAAIASRGDQ